MNLPLPADSTQPDAQSEAEDPIVSSILATTRWMQRAMSPWAQRWLARLETTSRETSREATIGGLRPQLTFTVGGTRQTLNRIRAQYESHAVQAATAQSVALPLAGRPSEPVQSAQPAVDTATYGPYAKPFNSVESFLEAVEAAKARNYAPPPPEEIAAPARPRTSGPYSKPFNSLESFVAALEAAKARNYAPPPPDEVEPPAPAREPGPYSHAFTSFEAFTKALEETRQKSAPAPSPAAVQAKSVQPAPPPLPSGKVRRFSRVEELPSRGSAPDTGSLAAPSTEAFAAPDQSSVDSPPAKVAATPADQTTPVSPVPVATPSAPVVIPPFSPAKARGGVPSKSSAAPSIQRTPATPQPLRLPNEPALSAPVQASEVAASTAVDQVTESALIQGDPTLPPAQRHETTAVDLPASEPPSFSPIRSDVPLPPQPLPVQPEPHAATPPIIPGMSQLATDNFAIVSRQAEETISPNSEPWQPDRVAAAQGPEAQPGSVPLGPTPLGATPPSPERSSAAREMSATRSPILPQASERVAPVPLAESTSAEAIPSPAVISSQAALPLVQRQVSEPTSIAPEAEAAPRESVAPTAIPEVAPDRSEHSVSLNTEAKSKSVSSAMQAVPEASPIIETAAPTSPQAMPSQPAMPLVQRQVSEPAPVAPEAEATPRESIAPTTIPAVTPDRTERSVPSKVEASFISRAKQAAPEIAPTVQAAVPTSPQAMPSQPALPLVQRQVSEPAPVATEAEVTPSESIALTAIPAVTPDRTERSVPPKVEASSVSSAKQAAPEIASAVKAAAPTSPQAMPSQPAMPLVQRQVSEPAPVALEAEAAPRESIAPTAIPEVTPDRAERSVPSKVEASSVSSTKLAAPEIAPAVKASAPTSPQAMPSQPAMPLVQQQASEPAPVAPEAEVTPSESIAPTTIPEVTPDRTERSVPPKVEASSVSGAMQTAPEIAPTVKAAVPTSPQAMPSQPAMPLVQRQVSEQAPVASEAEATPSESISATAIPEVTPDRTERSVPPKVEASPVSSTMQAAPEAAPTVKSPAPTSPQAMPSQPAMPLVQRQVSEQAPVASEAEVTPRESVSATALPEVTPDRIERGVPPKVEASSVSSAKQSAPEMPPAVKAAALTSLQATPSQPAMPLVQRQVSDRTPVEPEAEVTPSEATSFQKVTPDRSKRSMPRNAEVPPVAGVMQVPETLSNVKAAALTSLQAMPSQPAMPLVQRQVSDRTPVEPEVKALPTEVTPLPRVAADRSERSVPSASDLKPAPETPAEVKPLAGVARQEQSALDMPVSKALASHALPLVQRVPSSREEASRPQSAELPSQPVTQLDQPTVNLGERILARVAGPERAATAKLPTLPLHQPVVQRVSQPETKAIAQPVKSEVTAPPPSLAVSPMSAPPVIQRMPAESTAPSGDSDLIQRAGGSSPEAAEQAPASIDLDDLARQVYPILKRMLAVERERRSFR